MLTEKQKLEIAAQAKMDLEQELADAQAKKDNKGKKGKKGQPSGRDVVIDLNIINTFNAKVAAKGIGGQLRGNITSAKIDINDVEITMKRQPKVKDTDPVRYLVSGGHGKDLIAPKGDAIICLSERAVLTKDSIAK